MTARDKYSQVATLMMGDAVQMIVKKATTRIPDGPKRKHLNILINYANRPDSELSHLCKCVLNRIKKNHRMIAFKSLVLLNYLLVSCKKPELYRLLSGIPSVLSGPCFVDPTPEGAEITKRFLNYVDFINEKSNFFRQLGYNLDSGPKNELQEIIENSPEHILQELNYGMACLDVIFKQEINFNAFLSKPAILGNVVLVKDLTRIYTCLKKRTAQIQGNTNLFPEDAVNKLQDYMNRIEEITKKLNVLYEQALDMNLQSVVRLIESTRENSTNSNIPKNKKMEMVENEAIRNFDQNQTTHAADVPPPAYPFDRVAFEQNRTGLNNYVRATSKDDNLLDLDDIFGSNENISTNNTNDPFLNMGVQQNQVGGYDNPYDMNQSFFQQPPPHQNAINAGPYQNDLFGLQVATEPVNTSGMIANQEPFNQIFDTRSQINQPTKEVDPLDINSMIQKNLDFTSRNNNVFISQQPAISNVVPAQGMTGFHNTSYNPFPQNQGMQYQGYNQPNQVIQQPPLQSMGFQYNQPNQGMQQPPPHSMGYPYNPNQTYNNLIPNNQQNIPRF